jgi:hypothetical protein
MANTERALGKSPQNHQDRMALARLNTILRLQIRLHYRSVDPQAR